METTIKVFDKVKFRKPILIEGLPGIGNVGRVAASYLINELKMKKIAEIYSPHFLPLVILHNDSVAQMLKCEIYYYHGRENDILVLTGDTQSVSPEGHYDVVEKIVDFAKKCGVKEMITLGGFAESNVVEEPRVIGAVNRKELAKKYDKAGIDFRKDHNIGTIVGASGLLLGIGRLNDIDGLCLMGETVGMPLITDPKAADRVLHVLLKILKLKIDLSKLENTIKEMEERIKKTEKIHKNIMEQMPSAKKDDIRYIG